MQLAPQEPLSKIDYSRIGDSGTQRYSGYFQEEPQVQWRDENRITNVETMRRTDATIKQFLTAVKAPILSTEYDIQSAGEDENYQKHADFAKENLFGMERTWKEFLREALTELDFGFSVFEQIYKKKNGKIYIADLEPRIQHSIQRWQLNDGRRGIIQLILTDEINSQQRQAEIPMNKLLVFTNDKEGDDITGQSVLRPCWKHFYYKDVLYRIGAISCERFGVGIPVITLPPTSGETEQTAAEEMGESIRSNEKAYIVKPNKDWDIQILSPSGNPQQGQIDSLIQHHDRMILMAGLAGFLNLGSDSTGSYALSKDQSSFFLKHCEDIAQYICEQITKQVIERLIIINFGVQEKYPKLVFTPLGDIDFTEYSQALNTLATAGFLKVTPRDQQFARKTFKLRPLSDDEIAEMEAAEMEKALGEIDASGTEPEEDLPEEEDMPEGVAQDEDVDDGEAEDT